MSDETAAAGPNPAAPLRTADLDDPFFQTWLARLVVQVARPGPGGGPGHALVTIAHDAPRSPFAVTVTPQRGS